LIGYAHCHRATLQLECFKHSSVQQLDAVEAIGTPRAELVKKSSATDLLKAEFARADMILEDRIDGLMDNSKRAAPPSTPITRKRVASSIPARGRTRRRMQNRRRRGRNHIAQPAAAEPELSMSRAPGCGSLKCCILLIGSGSYTKETAMASNAL
jgi:hypothetical protein